MVLAHCITMSTGTYITLGYAVNPTHASYIKLRTYMTIKMDVKQKSVTIRLIVNVLMELIEPVFNISIKTWTSCAENLLKSILQSKSMKSCVFNMGSITEELMR